MGIFFQPVVFRFSFASVKISVVQTVQVNICSPMMSGRCRHSAEFQYFFCPLAVISNLISVDVPGKCPNTIPLVFPDSFLVVKTSESRYDGKLNAFFLCSIMHLLKG